MKQSQIQQLVTPSGAHRHTHTHTHTHAQTYTHTHTHTHTRTHTHTHTLSLTHLHTHSHTCVDAYTYNIHIHILSHIRLLLCCGKVPSVARTVLREAGIISVEVRMFTVAREGGREGEENVYCSTDIPC